MSKTHETSHSFEKSDSPHTVYLEGHTAKTAEIDRAGALRLSGHGNLDDLEARFGPKTVARDDLLWSKIRAKFQNEFSEFLGVFVLILFGDGVVAQVVLSDSAKGAYQSISWGWGLGVMLGVYVSGKSGSHLNPAVTLTNCVFRGFPWRKFPTYLIAQVLGAMLASAVVFGNYRSAITAFEGGPDILSMKTAGIFCTYPVDFISKTGQFFSEFVASAILMIGIYAINDDDNLGAGNLAPLCLFFLIFGIGACFGWETGYAINLARDFGPRLMSSMLGYPRTVWTAGNYYFWIPMVAPFFGCLFGAFLYDLLIYTGESPINTPWLGLKRLVRRKPKHH